MAKRRPKRDALDALIGGRLRTRRLQLDMTQSELGAALGVSYQQIQKYETGANRLSGAALTHACRALLVPIEYLLEERALQADDAAALEILASWRRIKDTPFEAHAARFIRTLAECGDAQRAQAPPVRDRALLDALPVAIYTTDAEGRLDYFNEAAVAFAGRTPRLMTDKWCVTWKLYRLDGSFLPHEDCPMAVALKENRPIRGASAIAERPDGARVQFRPHPTPLHDADGALVGGINMLLEVEAA